MQDRREQWSGVARTTQASRLVFLDESGVNISMARRYGQEKGNRRVIDHASLNTTKSTTILSLIRLDGTMTFTTFQGGTTADKFLNDLKEALIPALRPGDIAAMDNLRTHHARTVQVVVSQCRPHLFRRGRQVQPNVPVCSIFAYLYRKYFAHSVAPF